MKWEQGPPRHGHAPHKLPSCADCWREEAATERVRGDRLAALVEQAAGFLRNGSGYREQIAGWLMDAKDALRATQGGTDG